MAENTPMPLFFRNTSRNEMIVTQSQMVQARNSLSMTENTPMPLFYPNISRINGQYHKLQTLPVTTYVYVRNSAFYPPIPLFS